MTNLLVETVIMAFMVGGIIGAAAALTLRSSRFWNGEEPGEMPGKPVPIKYNSHIPARRRR